MKIELKHAFASEDGDYCQVQFETRDAEGEPYVLIQRQFEDPDRGVCYVETHDETYIGHAKVASASLSRTRFRLELRRSKAPELEIKFRWSHPGYAEVVRVLKIMIPDLHVEDV